MWGTRPAPLYLFCSPAPFPERGGSFCSAAPFSREGARRRRPPARRHPPPPPPGLRGSPAREQRRHRAAPASPRPRRPSPAPLTHRLPAGLRGRRGLRADGGGGGAAGPRAEGAAQRYGVGHAELLGGRQQAGAVVRRERQAPCVEEVEQQLEGVGEAVGQCHGPAGAARSEEAGAAGEHRPVRAELAAAHAERGVAELPGCALPVQLPQHPHAVRRRRRHGRAPGPAGIRHRRTWRQQAPAVTA